MPMMPLWLTVAGRGSPNLEGECGVENRMATRPSSGPQRRLHCLNALPCDFDDASSCRINHRKLGPSDRLPGVDSSANRLISTDRLILTDGDALFESARALFLAGRRARACWQRV